MFDSSFNSVDNNPAESTQNSENNRLNNDEQMQRRLENDIMNILGVMMRPHPVVNNTTANTNNITNNNTNNNNNNNNSNHNQNNTHLPPFLMSNIGITLNQNGNQFTYQQGTGPMFMGLSR